MKFKNFLKKTALSVSELALTLTVVGAVSALMVGTYNHVNEVKMETARTVLNDEIAISMAEMQADKALTGYSDTNSFTEKFKNYFNVEKVITDTNNLSQYFNETFKDENGKSTTLDTTKYTNYIVTTKGATIAYSYNTSCSVSGNFSTDSSSAGSFSYEAKNEALSCIEGIYDINGTDGPNEVGVDIGYIYKFDNSKSNCDTETQIPTSGGGCIDRNSTASCSVYNMTYNKSTKKCECTKSCPTGYNLISKPDENKCYCKSPAREYDSRLSTQEEGSFECIPNNPSYPRICASNGGTWDYEHCTCRCDSRFNDIKTTYHGYRAPNPVNMCQAECGYLTEQKMIEYNPIKNRSNKHLDKTSIS